MKHGTTTGYCYHKCRCEDCTRAQTNYMNKYRSTEHGRTRQKLNNEIYEIRKRIAAELLKDKYPELWAQVCAEADLHTTRIELNEMEDFRKFNGSHRKRVTNG